MLRAALAAFCGFLPFPGQRKRGGKPIDLPPRKVPRAAMLRVAPHAAVRSHLPSEHQETVPFGIGRRDDTQAGLVFAGTFTGSYQARRLGEATIFANKCVTVLAYLCGDDDCATRRA